MKQLELPFPGPGAITLKFSEEAAKQIHKSLRKQWFHPEEESEVLRLVEILGEHLDVQY